MKQIENVGDLKMLLSTIPNDVPISVSLGNGFCDAQYEGTLAELVKMVASEYEYMTFGNLEYVVDFLSDDDEEDKGYVNIEMRHSQVGQIRNNGFADVEIARLFKNAFPNFADVCRSICKKAKEKTDK